MIDILSATLVGFLFGAVVTLLKLPLPAPPVFSGVMGVMGCYWGYWVVSNYLARYIS